MELLELKTGGIPKNTRIKEGYKKLIAGDIGIHPSLRNKVADQFSTWNPLKKDNKDDILDIIGYLEKPLSIYPDFISYDILDETSYNMLYSEETDVIPAEFNSPF